MILLVILYLCFGALAVIPVLEDEEASIRRILMIFLLWPVSLLLGIYEVMFARRKW